MPESGQQIIAALKSGEAADVLAVTGFPGFRLRAVVTRPDAIRPGDARLLTQWRNLHVRSFLTEFVATEPRTVGWLGSVLHRDPGHILFMVDGPGGETLGYMGIGFIDWASRYGEADAIVRGSPHVPGLMRAGLCTLLLWSRDSLGLTRIGVRVLSDNPAIGFYRRIGFVETRRVPLRRMMRGDEVAWVESADESPVSREIIHHTLHWPSMAESMEAPRVGQGQPLHHRPD